MTLDLDVVPSRTAGNVQRLLAALAELDAVYRAQPERRLRPDPSHLEGAGHQLLITRFGPLDVLGSIGHGHTYEDLLPETEWMEIGDGVAVRVLKLKRLIEVKEETAGEKDRAALLLLRRLWEESQRE
ncbi:MAG: hypothetical protein HYZ57_07075 [Acidobacteria bacterium]|nr:hypothetical protein [Acidobacteriota bacterium]